ncbi:DUF6153 family protein [Yinghuangia sp. YIM S09857]|uniref:DUF6153 family protein n=1 Tax=Yinghuangia sp. YIM S09857 TaxID=3436929 RepID=UPI003F536411
MRIAATLFRLLLFAVIVLGTAGMHTIGHPPEARAAVTHVAEAPCPDGHCPASPAPIAGAADHRAPDGHHGAGGMDPMSLCLAVALAGFVLAVAWFAVGRRARGLARAARGAWGRHVSGLPPARPPDLSRLAVLRI